MPLNVTLDMPYTWTQDLGPTIDVDFEFAT